jgi:hypothetical protein
MSSSQWVLNREGWYQPRIAYPPEQASPVAQSTLPACEERKNQHQKAEVLVQFAESSWPRGLQWLQPLLKVLLEEQIEFGTPFSRKSPLQLAPRSASRAVVVAVVTARWLALHLSRHAQQG